MWQGVQTLVSYWNIVVKNSREYNADCNLYIYLQHTQLNRTLFDLIVLCSVFLAAQQQVCISIFTEALPTAVLLATKYAISLICSYISRLQCSGIYSNYHQPIYISILQIFNIILSQNAIQWVCKRKMYYFDKM